MSNEPFKNLSGYNQKNLLLQCMRQGYTIKNRKDPDNIDSMASYLREMLLKYMPHVTEAAIKEGIEHFLLHNDTTTLSVDVFFKAIKSKYIEPYQQRDMDRDEYTRPDTESDTIRLLDVLAENMAAGRNVYADWPRDYAYLILRKQFQWDAYEAELENAKAAINAERTKEMKRSIVDWIGQESHSLFPMAKQLAVKTWLRGITARGLKPSDILTPLIDDTEYSQFRYQLKYGRRSA